MEQTSAVSRRRRHPKWSSTYTGELRLQTYRRATPPAGCEKVPEKLLEKIAEAGPAEFEFHPTIAGAPALKATARLTTHAPPRGRLKSSRLTPIRAELVVFLPLLRVAQHLVSSGLTTYETLFTVCWGRPDSPASHPCHSAVSGVRV